MKNFIKGLLWGIDDKPSLTDTMALVTLLFFFAVSSYLVLMSQTWTHYETFTTVTLALVGSLKLGGKYINNK